MLSALRIPKIFNQYFKVFEKWEHFGGYYWTHCAYKYSLLYSLYLSFSLYRNALGVAPTHLTEICHVVKFSDAYQVLLDPLIKAKQGNGTGISAGK